MRVLFIGDIVGNSGRRALKEFLPKLKQKRHYDFIIANGENAAGGRGITHAITQELFQLGIHGITMGNHTWDRKEIFDFIDNEPRMIRPANFPEGTPGKGYMRLQIEGKELIVVNLQGRTFLPPLDCPFQKIDEILKDVENGSPCILVDFHAEATSEKIAFGWHVSKRVSASVGTHTHVQTNDAQLLLDHTAFITDVGMVGPRDGVLGMDKSAVLRRFQTGLPVRFEVSEGEWQFHAVEIEIEERTGKATQIQIIRQYENQWVME